jgi:hypothetical protein
MMRRIPTQPQSAVVFTTGNYPSKDSNLNPKELRVLSPTMAEWNQGIEFGSQVGFEQQHFTAGKDVLFPHFAALPQHSAVPPEAGHALRKNICLLFSII